MDLNFKILIIVCIFFTIKLLALHLVFYQCKEGLFANLKRMQLAVSWALTSATCPRSFLLTQIYVLAYTIFFKVF